MQSVSRHQRYDAVVGTVNFNIPEIFESQREFFDYKNAPWQRIKMDFEECDWALEFSGMNADEAAEHLTNKIMNTLHYRLVLGPLSTFFCQYGRA